MRKHLLLLAGALAFASSASAENPPPAPVAPTVAASASVQTQDSPDRWVFVDYIDQDQTHVHEVGDDKHFVYRKDDPTRSLYLYDEDAAGKISAVTTKSADYHLSPEARVSPKPLPDHYNAVYIVDNKGNKLPAFAVPVVDDKVNYDASVKSLALAHDIAQALAPPKGAPTETPALTAQSPGAPPKTPASASIPAKPLDSALVPPAGGPPDGHPSDSPLSKVGSFVSDHPIITGAAIGALIGIFFGPIGIIVGALVGAGVGAGASMLMNHNQ